jgi:large subunit ribosomal protein L13
MQNFVDVWHQDWKYNRDPRTDKKYRRKATGLMKISAEEDDKDEMREAMLEEMKDMDFASLEDTPDISSPLEAEALGEKNADGAAFAAEAGVSVDRAPAPEMMALGHVLRASAPRRSSEPEMKHRSAAISGRKKSTEGTRTPYDIRDPLIKGLSEAELKLIAQKTWMPVAVDRAKANKKWYLVDAEGMRLGRMASEIAKIVLGKHKPTFTPGAVMGDYVIVINADKVIVTGNKYNEKLYRRHSGYKGGLKVETFKTLQARIPERIVEKAVFGMLPKNRFGKACFHLLNVYKGPEHPHEAQLPQQITFSGLSERSRRTTAKDTANADYEGSGSIELIEATGKTDFEKAEVIPNRIDGYR